MWYDFIQLPLTKILNRKDWQSNDSGIPTCRKLPSLDSSFHMAKRNLGGQQG
jgi:hypothetical protein